MDREVLIDSVGGFFIPILVALIVQDGWSDRLKTLVSLTVIIVWCIIRTVYIRGVPMDADAWLTTFLISASFAWVSYRNFWKSLGFAPWLQSRTTIGG